jgi:hypothetical protein
MLPFLPSFGAIAISALYCLWQRYREAQANKTKALRERVARLLWEVANHGEAAA